MIWQDLRFGWTPERLAQAARVDRTTAWRWITGRSQPPGPVLALLELMVQGQLEPLAGPSWSGWQIRGRYLYSPWYRRPFEPEQIAMLPSLLRAHGRPAAGQQLELF